MLFVAGRQADRRRKPGAGARRRPAGACTAEGRPLNEHPAPLPRARLPSRLPLVAALTAAGCTVGPNYERPEARAAGAAPRRRAPRPQAGVDGRPAVVAGVPGPGAAGADPRRRSPTTSTCSIASARVVEARALAGIAKSYPVSRRSASRFGYSAEQRSRVGDPSRRKERCPTAPTSNWALTASALLGDRPLRPPPPRARRRPSPQYLATEEGRRAAAGHPGGRHGVDLLLPARARPPARDRQADASSSTTRRCDYYEKRLAGRRVEPPRGRPGQGQPGRARPRRSPTSSGRSRSPRTR
ncbi:MAG: hypothetical protein MZU97_09415 [Bacillus subtilis]|nr:hypothetical protein [Bacillus subtilis]